MPTSLAERHDYSEIIAEILIQLQQHDTELKRQSEIQTQILERMERSEAGFNNFGSAVRHGRYNAALSGTGARPSRHYNRTAVHISPESNHWSLITRRLFRISSIPHRQAGPGVGNYTTHKARRRRTRS